MLWGNKPSVPVLTKIYLTIGHNELTEHNGSHFADVIFICIFLKEKFCILIQISLKIFPKIPIENMSVLIQVMAWCCIQVTSYYLIYCWPRSLNSYYITETQCVKATLCITCQVLQIRGCELASAAVIFNFDVLPLCKDSKIILIRSVQILSTLHNWKNQSHKELLFFCT